MTHFETQTRQIECTLKDSETGKDYHMFIEITINITKDGVKIEF
jgi:hypothetical protein